MLMLRPIVRQHIKVQIGYGISTSFWFDNLHPLGPLDTFCFAFDHLQIGFSKSDDVSVIIDEGGWHWPEGKRWTGNVVNIINTLKDLPEYCSPDKVYWDQKDKTYSIKEGLILFLPPVAKVDWYPLVWFKNCIAFILWLVCKSKLYS